MNNFTQHYRKAGISMRLSEFEMPPMQDVLIIGKNAAIGPEAARKMVDIICPEQYEMIRTDHAVIEAVVIRKALTGMIEKEKLISLILEEGGKVADQSSIIKIQIDAAMQVSKQIDL